MMALLAATLALASPTGERVFGNWTVRCDKAVRCQAVALRVAVPDKPTPVAITRDPGPVGAVVITILSKAARGRVSIRIDGKPVAPAILLESGIRLDGAEAEGLARAIANGKRMEVRDYKGKHIVSISLAGASGALRWIDVQQGRAGGLTALVARGPKSATLVPAAGALSKARAP